MPHLKVILDEFVQRKDVTCIVVDDHSTDGGMEYCASRGVSAIKNCFDKGRDGALRTALLNVSSADPRDWIVFFDGDGQHCPSFLDGLANVPLPHDALKGNRFFSRELSQLAPFDRVLIARLFSSLTVSLLGFEIADVNCGLLGFSAKYRDFALSRCTFDRHISTELYIRLQLEFGRSVRLAEYPIKPVYMIKNPSDYSKYILTSPSDRFFERAVSLAGKIRDIVGTERFHADPLSHWLFEAVDSRSLPIEMLYAVGENIGYDAAILRLREVVSRRSVS